MTKKHLATGLLAVVLIAVWAPFSAAQSGRGRQLRIAERLNGQPSADDSVPEDARAVEGAVSETRSSLSGKINKSRNARLIYRNNTEDTHPNRADKKAGWIGLGFLAFEIAVMIANDGDFWSPR